MLKEAKTQSPWYRKVGGYFCILVGLVICFLQGFDFYTSEVSFVWPPLTMGTVLLGIGNITDIWKK